MHCVIINLYVLSPAGLDSSVYRAAKQSGPTEEKLESITQVSVEEYYRLCERFSFTCPSPSCDNVITMDSPLQGVVRDFCWVLFCPLQLTQI